MSLVYLIAFDNMYLFSHRTDLSKRKHTKTFRK
ncbi:hypothetical protein VPHF99_0130 [Vibrio phage F99]